jgi:hypothetical protein
MATCANCGATLSCGCQKRTTSDGKSACSNCINKIQKTIKPKAETKSTTTTTTPPNNQVWGPNRYLNLQKFTKK